MTANNTHAQVTADDAHPPKVHASSHEAGGSDELEVTSLATSETDDSLVLAPDGAGGVEFRAEAGGGGGGGVTIQYPALKPATPTYDFAGASLHADFSAQTITLADVLTQGADWVGSSVEIPFTAQTGGIYVSHANADFDVSVGGLDRHGVGNAAMIGIAALNSSGSGVGVMQYNDGNAYFATISGYAYTTQSHTFNGFGHNIAGNRPIWLRIKRVSGTWTAYVSLSGNAWDATSATRSDSVTVDRIMIGVFLNNQNGRLTADYLDIAV